MQQLPQPAQLPQPPQLPAPPALAKAPQAAVPVRDLSTMTLAQLRAHADALKLRVNDLEVQLSQITERRGSVFPGERHIYDKPLADVSHELASARIQLEAAQRQLAELEAARVGTTLVPPLAERGIQMDMERERMIGAASFILLLPLVLAWSRRIWHRGAPRPSVDLENSPRLQRMEQAIESIALEVERIGEAQRFTTKLLSERQPEAAARIGVPRREPGTITPH